MADVPEPSYLQVGRLRKVGGGYIVRQQSGEKRKVGARLEK